jgi:crotonobetainyl-CoA:carnitine CoA-transferase CaiB-like acyl-CoA transferase
MTHALAGLRVLDFSRVLAGPFCTMLLADFGAEVIKVEQPNTGDDTRQWGPPYAGELSAYYLSVNRNKRSLTLNLKTPEGVALARQLALQSDVLVENFKVGGMAAYGLDYAALRPENSGLVYCSITGYGQTGPYAERPGYDYVIQAQSGLMSITGPKDGEPYKVGVAISDVLTGLFASNAIQSALLHREKTGEGQAIDISLLDSQIAALVNVASNYLVTGTPPARHGNAHANIVPYEAFPASDGMFILAVGNDGQFRAACAVIGQPELAQDTRFATNPTRVQNREELIEILRELFKTRTAEAWVEAFLEAGVPAAPIQDIPTALTHPHSVAHGLVERVTLADGSQVDLLAPIQKLSQTPPTIHRPPPLLGQDTDAVLRDLLGLDATTIADYHARGII